MTDHAAMVSDGQEFLTEFRAKDRNKGDALCNSGAVRSIDCVTPDTCYVAKVAEPGRGIYQVELTFSDADSTSEYLWDGQCSCPHMYECKHIYAAMKMLLVRLGSGSKRAERHPAVKVVPDRPKRPSRFRETRSRRKRSRR